MRLRHLKSLTQVLLLLSFARGAFVHMQRWHMSPLARRNWRRGAGLSLELGVGSCARVRGTDPSLLALRDAHGLHGEGSAGDARSVEIWARAAAGSGVGACPLLRLGRHAVSAAVLRAPPAAGAAAAGAWRQVLLTLLPDGSAALGLDGQDRPDLAASFLASSAEEGGGGGDLLLGCSCFAGRLRFLRSWRPAPSRDQLSHLHNAGFVLGDSALDTAGLVGFWPLLGGAVDNAMGFAGSVVLEGAGAAWVPEQAHDDGVSAAPAAQLLQVVDGSDLVPLHVVSHSFSEEYDPYWQIYLDWILQQLLAQLRRPVLWVVGRCGKSREALRRCPACCSIDDLLLRNHSLVLVNAHTNPRIDFAALADVLRERRARDVGFLHLNHEQPWARRAASPMAPQDDNVYAGDLAADYAAFSYGFRNHFWLPLDRSAPFVPLGPAKFRPDAPVAAIAGGSQATREWEAQQRRPASHRAHLCSFSGSVGSVADAARTEMLEGVRQFTAAAAAAAAAARAATGGALETPCHIDLAPRRAVGNVMAEKWRYLRVLFDSQFVLCPCGNSAETFRLYEALEAGAVPLLVRPPPDKDFLRVLSPHTPPFPVLQSWDELAAALMRLRAMTPGGRDRLQRATQEWYRSALRRHGGRVAASIGASFARSRMAFAQDPARPPALNATYRGGAVHVTVAVPGTTLAQV